MKITDFTDEEIFSEAERRIKEHPLKVLRFEVPLSEIFELTVKDSDGKEIKGVFFPDK